MALSRPASSVRLAGKPAQLARLDPAERASKSVAKKNIRKNSSIRIFVIVAVISSFFGFLGGSLVGGYLYYTQEPFKIFERETVREITEKEYIPQSTQEEKIINVVKNASPAVVSIIITKDVPIIERFFEEPLEDFFGQPPFSFQVPQFRERGTEKREVGGGSGFFISADGMLVTNRHVVLEDDVDYTVFTTEGESYPATVLARDPVQDLAILQIQSDGKIFPFVELGNSDSLEIGQTVIAIGNALGEFRNTVSVGVISGLGRTITASDGSGTFVETIEDVVQTDAAINRGNSGGPLLNLAGEVIGVNTATVLQAQNIGFAIPSNRAERDVKQVKEIGRIVYPFLGIQYSLITQGLKEEQNLPVEDGAFISTIMPDSAAQAAGLQVNDIILEFNKEKITIENSLAKILQKYNAGDIVSLTVLRDGSIIFLSVTLGERSE